MRPLHCDVLVLGGGPAGSASALFLARRGYRTILVDRAVFPRPKPCGEYLTPGALRLLRDDIGVLPEMLRRGAARLQEERIVGHDGRGFGGGTEALSCPRSATDYLLLQTARSAGVEVREGFSARRILTEAGRVIGAAGIDSAGMDWKIHAAATIGADGTRSLLARTLNVVRPVPRLHRIALVGHFRADGPISPEKAAVMMHLPHAGGVSGACCGVGGICGPEDGRIANVNIAVPNSESGRIAGRKDDYYRETLHHSFPAVWERFADSELAEPVRTVGCFAHHTARASAPGALLVGDAATFIHPFTGEGVYFALRGAQLAAESIDAAFRQGTLRESASFYPYDLARRRELLPRYRLCDLVARIVHSPALLGWAGERLRRSPILTRTLLQTVGDIARPADLFTPANLCLLLATL